MAVVWVFVGGGAGSALRWLASGWVARAAGTALPWGTLAVNVVGSFLLSLILHVGLTTDLLSPDARLALTTGAMGGFTTYSTFSYETLELLRAGALGLAAANVGVTVVLCLAASFLGLAAGRALFGG